METGLEKHEILCRCEVCAKISSTKVATDHSQTVAYMRSLKENGIIAPCNTCGFTAFFTPVGFDKLL